MHVFLSDQRPINNKDFAGPQDLTMSIRRQTPAWRWGGQCSRLFRNPQWGEL